LIVPSLISILVEPLYSKKLFPACLAASSQLSNVNVYLISFSPFSFAENVGVPKVFVITLFAFASPSTVIVISSVVNVLFSTLVKRSSVAIKSAVTFLLILSIFTFSIFHTGVLIGLLLLNVAISSFASPSFVVLLSDVTSSAELFIPSSDTFASSSVVLSTSAGISSVAITYFTVSPVFSVSNLVSFFVLSVVLSTFATLLSFSKAYIVVITFTCSFFVIIVTFSSYMLGSYSTLSISTFCVSLSTAKFVFVSVFTSVVLLAPSVSLFNVESGFVCALPAFASSEFVFAELLSVLLSSFFFSTIWYIETSYAFCIVCFSSGILTLVNVAKSISLTSIFASIGI